MEEKLQQLKTHLARVADLKAASQLLNWDQETCMPLGGITARADQIGTLESLAHHYMVSDEVGSLLQDLAAYLDELDYDSDEASIIRYTMREYEKQVRVPTDLIEEIFRHQSHSQQAWVKARKENRFTDFEPFLSKMVELKIRWAECFDTGVNPYNPLLDYYEPGITYDQIDDVFSALKPPLVELVKAITQNSDAVDDSVLHQPYDHDAQLAFSKKVAAAIGYDFDHGRLDLVAHPFTTSFSRYDVRLTTRVTPDFLPSCLMAVIHEAGHGMYEQNTSQTLYRTTLDEGASYSAHESQSRFYENVIGRSRPFWKYWYPHLQEAFPQLKSVDMETWYRAINRSQPSLIRVEADEVTYGLHIMLRFELENDLINGRVRVADLPKEWNARMEAYLGVVPPTDSDGVLQDVHWSWGYIGYFPDYLLGSIFAAQLWEKLQEERPSVLTEIESGQYDGILAWQVEKIQKHGKKFTLPELSERATGGPLRWEPYMEYLKTKYSEIYGL